MTTTTIALSYGLVLAGGASRRMGGGDKTQRRLAGRPMLDHVIERLAPQCAGLLVNTNELPPHATTRALSIVTDSLPDRPGPLAGILAGLDWVATHAPDVSTVVSVPGDTPFIPPDLVDRLAGACAAQQAEMAHAASGGRTHWTIGLWPVALRAPLRVFLVQDNLRRVERFVQLYRTAVVDWPSEPVDPFFNVNTPHDLAVAETLVRSIESL